MNFFSILQRKKYQHLNKVFVSSSAIRHNYKTLQDYHPEAQICPVLKSNAYGAGLVQTAHIFDSLGAPFLVVDSLYEAYKLYKQKVKTPILILGYTIPENFKVKRLPFVYGVYDLEVAKALNTYQPGAAIHIFVDTGMTREGVQIEHLDKFVKELKKLKKLRIEGLASHFAEADNAKSFAKTKQQVENFKQAYEILKSNGIDPKWRHISASAGAFKLHDEVFTMIRVGKAMYGVSPLELVDPFYKKLKLEGVLSFESTIAQIKSIKKGTEVGYSFTYKTPKDMNIAILPAGYYEGVDRRLSNKGVVQVNGRYCPIIGRVSMNMTAIDVTTVNCKVRDKVVIYSNKTEDKNSIYNTAITAGTIPYEIVVHIAESVRREVV